MAVAGGLSVLRSPVLAGLALVGLVPVTSGIKRGLPVPGFRLSEILIVGLGVLIFLTADRHRRAPWRGFDWIALAYVFGTAALGVLNTHLRSDALGADELGTLFGPLQFFLLYRAALVAFPTAADRRRAVDVVLLASLPVSALAIMQTIDAPGVREAMIAATGEDFSGRLEWTHVRASGPFTHWNMLSGYLLAIILLGVAVMFHRRDRRMAVLAVLPAAAALVTTVTLASMIAAVLGVLMLATWSRRLVRTVVIAAVGALLLGVAFAPLLAARAEEQYGGASQYRRAEPKGVLPSTVVDRIDIWTEQYFPVVQQNFLTGYGPQLPDVRWTSSENVYLTMVLRGGLPLLAVFLALMLSAAVLARRRHDAAAASDLSIARTLYALTLLMALIQLLVPYFVTSGLPHLWWALVALVVAAVPERTQETRPSGAAMVSDGRASVSGRRPPAQHRPTDWIAVLGGAGSRAEAQERDSTPARDAETAGEGAGEDVTPRRGRFTRRVREIELTSSRTE